METRPQPPYRQMELSPHAVDGEMHSPERVREKVQELRLQAELYEQQRLQTETQSRELEQSTLRKADFNAYLNDVGRNIHNAVCRIERELETMNNEQRELVHVSECFKRHLQILSSLQPQLWPPHDVTERLRDALPKVERAENDFNEAYAMGRKYRHTDILQCKPGEVREDRLTWRKLKEEMARGLAFHLPLFLLILTSWVVYILLTA